eukprot:scaffold5651_cov108-Isochrysis_galbana.AAC.5
MMPRGPALRPTAGPHPTPFPRYTLPTTYDPTSTSYITKSAHTALPATNYAQRTSAHRAPGGGAHAPGPSAVRAENADHRSQITANKRYN